MTRFASCRARNFDLRNSVGRMACCIVVVLQISCRLSLLAMLTVHHIMIFQVGLARITGDDSFALADDHTT